MHQSREGSFLENVALKEPPKVKNVERSVKGAFGGQNPWKGHFKTSKGQKRGKVSLKVPLGVKTLGKVALKVPPKVKSVERFR